jgi:hypothetical protein
MAISIGSRSTEDKANRRHSLKLILLDEDGRLVGIPTLAGETTADRSRSIRSFGGRAPAQVRHGARSPLAFSVMA